jgi:hypothetical protein
MANAQAWNLDHHAAGCTPCAGSGCPLPELWPVPAGPSLPASVGPQLGRWLKLPGVLAPAGDLVVALCPPSDTRVLSPPLPLVPSLAAARAEGRMGCIRGFSRGALGGMYPKVEDTPTCRGWVQGGRGCWGTRQTVGEGRCQQQAVHDRHHSMSATPHLAASSTIRGMRSGSLAV